MSDDFVGRTADSERIARWLSPQSWAAHPSRLRVGAVCGPGGVGKTRLVHHALDPLALASGGFLVLRIAGGEHPDVRDVFAWVEWLIESASEVQSRVRSPFAHTRRLLHHQRVLSQRLVEDLRGQKLDEKTIEGARFLYGLGRISEKVLKQDVRGLLLRETWDDLKVMREAAENGPFRSTTRFLADALQPDLRRYRDNRLAALADALVRDLEGFLSNSKVTPEFHRLLLIIDDYEFLEPILAPFLIESLMPRLRSKTARLAEADFESFVLIVGRDELRNTAGAIWQQTPLREDLDGRQIILSPLTRNEVEALCLSKGHQASVAEFVYQASQGYPWLAEVIVDEMGPDGSVPAIVYTNFFERMSRFMNPVQRNWFRYICFLDQITLEGIEQVVDFSETPGFGPKDVLQWFRHEPSIRDTRSTFHAVWPFVRERVLMAQWIDSKRDFAALAQRVGLKYDPDAGPVPSRSRPIAG